MSKKLLKFVVSNCLALQSDVTVMATYLVTMKVVSLLDFYSLLFWFRFRSNNHQRSHLNKRLPRPLSVASVKTYVFYAVRFKFSTENTIWSVISQKSLLDFIQTHRGYDNKTYQELYHFLAAHIYINKLNPSYLHSVIIEENPDLVSKLARILLFLWGYHYWLNLLIYISMSTACIIDSDHFWTQMSVAVARIYSRLCLTY